MYSTPYNVYGVDAPVFNGICIIVWRCPSDSLLTFLYTISCKIIKPCMRVQSGMVQCHIPYLGHYDLLFTFKSIHQRQILFGPYLKYCFMQDQQTLPVDTS